MNRRQFNRLIAASPAVALRIPALAAGTPALIELRLDPEAITSRTTLTKLREAALARQAKA